MWWKVTLGPFCDRWWQVVWLFSGTLCEDGSPVCVAVIWHCEDSSPVCGAVLWHLVWRQFPCLCLFVLLFYGTVWRQFPCCVCVCLCGCSVALCLFPCLCCCSVALCLKTVPLFMSVLWCFVWRWFPYFVYGREKVNTLEFCLKERSVERPPCLIPPAHSGTGF